MYNAVLKARGQSLKTRRDALSMLPIPPNMPHLVQLSITASLELISREIGHPKSNAMCCNIASTEPHVLVKVMPSVTTSSWCCNPWGAVRKRTANAPRCKGEESPVKDRQNNSHRFCSLRTQLHFPKYLLCKVSNTSWCTWSTAALGEQQ